MVTPLLRGHDLNAYILAGMQSDHESTLLDEAEEKLRRGMYIFIREGSTERNIADLIGLVTQKPSHGAVLPQMTAMRISFLQKDILTVACGGLSSAGSNRNLPFGWQHFPRPRDSDCPIAELLPGRKADFCVVDDLHQFMVKKVFVGGKEVHRFIPCPAPAFLQPSTCRVLSVR